jgi:DNA-directed RNA polymerase specialized sigma24 family protein
VTNQVERVSKPECPERQGLSGDLRSTYSIIRRSATRILRNRDDAEDVAQEVLLRVLRRQAGAGFVAPSAWLRRITINLCLNRLRDERRHRELLAGFGPTCPREPAPDTGAMLRQLLREIPGDFEHPVLRHYLDDESHLAISKELGVSRRTVGNRIAAFHAWLSERS